MTAYNEQRCAELIAELRAEVKRSPYAAHRAEHADQLEAAVAEIARLRTAHTQDAATDENTTDENTTTATKLTAWCPDDPDERGERVYTGGTVRKIAEYHAEHMYYAQRTTRVYYEQRTRRRECFAVRVRVIQGDVAREWDVEVDVETGVRFRAAPALLRRACAK